MCNVHPMNLWQKLYSSLTRPCFICKVYQACMPFCIGWVENFDEIPLSCMVKEIETNLCLSILAKIQNGRHFWGGENFLKIVKSTFIGSPWDRKFQQNHSISILGKNLIIQNGRHFWGREIF